MCNKVTKCQKAYQIHVYFSVRFMVSCSYCIFDAKNISMKSTFQLFPLTICNVFLQYTLKRFMFRQWENTSNCQWKKVYLGQVHTPITTDLWLLNYRTCASQYKGESLSRGKATVLVSTGPRLILYDNRVQEHRHSFLLVDNFNYSYRFLFFTG